MIKPTFQRDVHLGGVTSSIFRAGYHGIFVPYVMFEYCEGFIEIRPPFHIITLMSLALSGLLSE